MRRAFRRLSATDRIARSAYRSPARCYRNRSFTIRLLHLIHGYRICRRRRISFPSFLLHWKIETRRRHSSENSLPLKKRYTEIVEQFGKRKRKEAKRRNRRNRGTLGFWSGWNRTSPPILTYLPTYQFCSFSFILSFFIVSPSFSLFCLPLRGKKKNERKRSFQITCPGAQYPLLSLPVSPICELRLFFSLSFFLFLSSTSQMVLIVLPKLSLFLSAEKSRSSNAALSGGPDALTDSTRLRDIPASRVLRRGPVATSKRREDCNIV